MLEDETQMGYSYQSTTALMKHLLSQGSVTQRNHPTSLGQGALRQLAVPRQRKTPAR
ncbi:MAG: hypothetical protein WBZ04_11740 [Candidatus Nanopelagicales bacterium]